ncbi:MAG: metallophosphoesterase family protein [Chloroflexota bacterium]
MMTTHFKQFLSLLLVLVLNLSCTFPSSPELLPSSEQVPASAKTPAPPKAGKTPKPKQTKTPKVVPTSSYVPSIPSLSIILGRPTTNSVTANLLVQSNTQATITYGTASGKYIAQTSAINLQAKVPQNIELTGLTPNTTYYYKVITNGTASSEHIFSTQRSSGSTFTFTIDADPHNRDPRFNGELYATTLTNALNNRPDFHIDLGDTFMTEKVKPQTSADVESTFTDMRPYFGIIGVDAPLFLVNGNHEGELGWLLASSKDKNLPIWSTQLRQRYYPNPVPNGFYTGSGTRDAALGSVRDGYYAWTWGDALFIVLDPFWYTTQKPQPGDLNNNWNWTLGKEQYDWLKSTLESSHTKFKFVFTHHLVGGSNEARGGIEFAKFFEWGGQNADGSDGFNAHRSGWTKPIHQLLVENHVSAVFHGHDHVFVKQDLDGIVYQELPQPSNADNKNTQLASEYGYLSGNVFSSSGHLQITVSPSLATVSYVRAFLPQNVKPNQQNGQVDFKYELK